MNLDLLWYFLALLLALSGLAGTVLPALPGIPLLFAGMLLAAWVDGFHRVGPAALATLAILTLASVVLDLWAGALGARRVGASRFALAGAVGGTVAGMFFGIPGLLIGPFAGAVAGELLHLRRLDHHGIGHAAKVGAGTWVGIAIATALKLAMAFAMIGIFVLAWVF